MSTSEIKAEITRLKGIADGRLREVERENAELRDRVEQIESKADMPGRTVSQHDGEFSRADVDHKAAFTNWLRSPRDGNAKRALDDAQTEAFERKAVTIGTDAQGGYALPAMIAADIEQRVTTLNPFRRICRVNRVGSSDYAHLVSRNEQGTGWVGEGAARSETDTSTLIERKPTFGTLYSYPKCSEEALADIFFDVGAWLVQEVSDAFAAQEATAFVTGDGSAKPTGFLNSAPVSTADGASPERAAGTLQYIPMDSASPQALGADDLFDLAGSFLDGYLMDQSSVAWVMRQSTLTTIRKLKDSQNQYLWQPGLQQGVPGTLLGHPVFVSQAMQSYVADAHPIAFGNWDRGYLIADRSEIRVTIDDNISTPGQVKFYVRKRVGGCILNDQAIKVLKFADS